MLSRWRIRSKLYLTLLFLILAVGTLSFSSFRGVYAYRGLAKWISLSAVEIDLPLQLARHVSNLRETVSKIVLTKPFPVSPTQKNIDIVEKRMYGQKFNVELDNVENTISLYSQALDHNAEADHAANRYRAERAAVLEIRKTLSAIKGIIHENNDWFLDEDSIEDMTQELFQLHNLAADLPTFLQAKMESFAQSVRRKYRTWIGLTWATSLSAIPLLLLTGLCLYTWIFCPLRNILRGSREIVSGNFDRRIQMKSVDEMGEVADAMNKMTSRFQEIRDDLDKKVQQRTKEVVRSEQLASVGFLAAGVAHEINNPLASIALCAESLEDRLHDIIQEDDDLPDEQHNQEVEVLRNYLRMIQDEAFRCKNITQQLLDFSRLGDVEKQTIDLTSLVQGVIEMVGHVGQYREKQIRFRTAESVYAAVNSQEMKQVVLNLLTNAMDSLDTGGVVDVHLHRVGDFAELVVKDNGCGMTEEVKRHLFEPFFTRRRDGQGTGLGMSITYRIIADHGGTIEAESPGADGGSTVVVQMPIDPLGTSKETHHRYQGQAA
jgi:two-component system NtrC family sensor kinase